jgi:hypothetical protein
MTAQPWTGIECLKPKGLCFGGFDDFPNVYPHPVTKYLQLIHERDIDGSLRAAEIAARQKLTELEVMVRKLFESKSAD